MTRSLLLLLAVFLVSSAGAFAHRALAEATPLAIAAWRLGLASLVFLGWSAVGSREAPPPRLGRAAPATAGVPSTYPRLVLAGVCLALHFLVWFASLQYASVARATLLVCTTPLWTTAGNLLLGRRRFQPAYWLALVLAAAGIGLVTHADSERQTRLAWAGDLLATSGGLLFAVYLLAMEGLHRTVSSRRQVTVTYSIAAVLLWGVLLAHGGLTLSYSAGVWGALLGMTLGPQVFGHTLLNWSLRHFPSSTVAFSILLEPVLAAWLAWLVFHQAVTAGQIAGGALVLAGLGVVIAQQPPAARVEDEPVG